MNSKRKGGGGEREFAGFLREHGFQARRSQQYRGCVDAPDIISNLPFHIEVKRCERLQLRDWVAQAESDAKEKAWLIAWRFNGGPWLITLKGDDFMALVRESLPISVPPLPPEEEATGGPQKQNETNQNSNDMKIDELYPSKWLKALDVSEKPVLVTIKNVAIEEISDSQEKPVLRFLGNTKPLVLNRTNFVTIAEFLGEDSNSWPNKQVVLFCTKVNFQGQLVSAIRVRPPRPTAAKPAAVPQTAPTRPSVVAENLSSSEEELPDDVPF